MQELTARHDPAAARSDTAPALSPPVTVGRLLEGSALAFAALAWAAKVALAVGGPAWLVWIALAISASLAALAVARPGRAWLDGWRLALLVPAFLQLPATYPRLAGDGYQCYVLLRSPLMDGDFELGNDYEMLGARPVRSPQGEITSRFPIGTALVWLPPFLGAHAVSVLGSWLGMGLPADGGAPLYQAAVTCFTFAGVLVALVLIEGTLRRSYGAAVAALTVLGVWLATPVNFYMVANPFMTHGPQVLAATLFVLAWLRARAAGGVRGWALAGAAGGLMLLVRPQDGVLLALPCLDLLMGGGGRRLRPLLAYLAGPAAAGSLQVLVWLELYGTAFAQVVSHQSYVGHTEPQILSLLFSARHGLFTWTPLYALAVVGWVLWLRRERRLAGLTWLGFALSVAINSAMQDWWGSSSFGQRRLLGLTPLFAFGLAETLRALLARPMVLVGALVAALAAWNFQFASIYNRMLIAPRTQALSLDQVASAQVRMLAEWVVRLRHRLPDRLFVLLYDNLSGVWLDESPRSLGGQIDVGDEPDVVPRLLGDGWYSREREGDTTLRRSRDDQSKLVVPVRTLGAFDVVIRLRPEMKAAPLRVGLEINGRPMGAIEARAGWQEYRLSVPPGVLRSGLNDIVLRYSATPRGAVPDYVGRNAAVAVDWLRLERKDRRPGPV